MDGGGRVAPLSRPVMSGESYGEQVEMRKAEAEYSVDSVTFNVFRSVEIGRIEAPQVSGVLMRGSGCVLVGEEPRRVMLTWAGWATARVARPTTKRKTLSKSFIVRMRSVEELDGRLRKVSFFKKTRQVDFWGVMKEGWGRKEGGRGVEFLYRDS